MNEAAQEAILHRWKSHHLPDVRACRPFKMTDEEKTLYRTPGPARTELTADDVRGIRRLLSLGNNIDDVAQAFKISRGHIRKIERGAVWGHVQDEPTEHRLVPRQQAAD